MQTMRFFSAFAASALCCASAIVAQDECTGAITIVDGTNGPFDSSSMTTSAPPFTCVPGGGSDMWFVYVASGTGDATVDTCGTPAASFDTCIEGYSGDCANLVSLACNDDTCGLQSSITFPVSMGSSYYIRVGGFNAQSGTFPLDVTLTQAPLRLEGVMEVTPGSGTLGLANGTFADGYTLRWNYSDPSNIHTGTLAAITLNFNTLGSIPVGATVEVPGLMQVWAGSTPPGYVEISSLLVLPTADQSVTIPPGAFNPGDAVRIQAVVLDAANAPGTFPVVPSENALTYVSWPCVAGQEGFEGVASGVGNYPTNWSNGGGIQEWQVWTGPTFSGGTGPNGAFVGQNYMYCETSSPVATGDTFIMNTDVYPSAGLTEVGFLLSRVGATVGTLEVRLGDGTGTFPTLLGTYVGGTTAEWSGESLPLGTGLPANIQLQFHYTRGTSFTGDVAIDEFCLR